MKYAATGDAEIQDRYATGDAEIPGSDDETQFWEVGSVTLTWGEGGGHQPAAQRRRTCTNWMTIEEASLLTLDTWRIYDIISYWYVMFRKKTLNKMVFQNHYLFLNLFRNSIRLYFWHLINICSSIYLNSDTEFILCNCINGCFPSKYWYFQNFR